MSEHKHLYNRVAWRRLRVAQLSASPLCCMCEQLDRLVPATVVDHVKPHRGDEELFFDETNLQSLCKPCHDAHKQAQEHNVDGILRGAGHDGLPIDRGHPFHRPARPEMGPPSASAVQTSPRAAACAIAAISTRAEAGRAIVAGQGGVKSSRPTALKTGHVPSFATCQYSEGGV